MTKEIVAYKGFDKDLKCRDFQDEVGETYEHEGEVVRCAEGGFHSCESPLDVFGYYSPGDSRFAVVKNGGEIATDEDDTKIASGKITIEAEINIHEMVQAGIDWVWANVKKSKKKHNTGDYSAASNTGYQSAASNTGNRSAASNTGDYSAASNTGDRSAASNTGYQSAASNTGNQSAASNTGYQSAASNTGYQSAASVEGQHSVAIATGYKSRAKASKTGAICLVHRNNDYEITHIRASMVGKNGIKPNTYYTLDKNGKFVEEGK